LVNDIDNGGNLAGVGAVGEHCHTADLDELLERLQSEVMINKDIVTN
jgi:hypothetical protein